MFRRPVQPVQPTPSLSESPKSWLESSTVRASLVTIFASFVLTILPNCTNIATRMWPQQKDNIADVSKILQEALALISTLSGGTAIAGRIEAKTRIYTPKGLPGPNQEDLL